MIEIAGMLLLWQSDWNGYEVGYPEIDIVGYYTDTKGMNYYIDLEKDSVLESWEDEDEE